RCKECSSTLFPGSYKPGPEAGAFVCTQHRGKLAVSVKAERRPSPDLQPPELRAETGADSMAENALHTAAEVGKDDGNSQESVSETPAEGLAAPAEKDSTASEAEAPTPPAHAGSGAPASQTPPRPPIPSKPAGLTQDKASSLEGRLRDSRPTPAPRKATDALSPPTSHPVPRPRSTLQGEGSECGPGMVGYLNPAPLSLNLEEDPAPLIVPLQCLATPPCLCHLNFSFSSTSGGAAARAKDPPWMALVQAEPKKKPAPPPPPGNSHETPSRTAEEEDGEEVVGKARGEESRSDTTEPKPYNPFEEEDEEEVESADTQKSTSEREQTETAAKPLHPWYGITPTSSPKAKKRPAPRAPNASPLAHHPISRLSHSEPSSSTPSPALSLESINSESSAKVLADADEASVPKSSSEPTVHMPTAAKTSSADAPLASVSSSESPAVPGASLSTNSSFSSSSKLASLSGETQPSTLHASRSISTGSLKTSPSRLPPKPPAGASPTPILLASDGGAGSPKTSSSPKPQLK
ncbi:MILK1 protein, partial [Chaetops frenatus]|nr:MILK1 protein [Chaetops frenatus]